MRTRTRLESEAGYSLIELLVSSAVMLIVTGAIFGLMNPAHGSAQAQNEVADVQQRARIGTDVLFKDLMMAGAGVFQGASSGSLINYFAAILPRRGGFQAPEPATLFRPDAITLTYVPTTYAQTTISQSMPYQSPVLKVNEQPNCPKKDGLCGFAAGMVVLIFDSTGNFDTFEITSVQSSAANLKHMGQNLAYSYPAGSNVTSIYNVTYYRDAATNQLRRYDQNVTDIPVVDNVVDMQISYFGDPEPPKLPKPPVGMANCLYDASGNYLNLPVLPKVDGSLAALTPAMLTDGPFCGGGSNQFDGDLLRVRKVRIMLRTQVASALLRGLDGTLWKNPGKSTGGNRTVPDYTVTIEVAPRNLNLTR